MHDEHQESPNTSSIPKPTNGAGNLPPDPKRATKPDWLSRAIERGSKRFLRDETGATIDLVGQEIDRLARRITSDRPDEKERATAAIVDAWLVHFAAGETALRSRIGGSCDLRRGVHCRTLGTLRCQCRRSSEHSK